MKNGLFLLFGSVLISLAANGGSAQPAAQPHDAAASMPPAIFTKYQDCKWSKILPDLGDDSPEVCILRVDPKTQVTQLLIRAPKAIHVRKHWHSANETHTVITGNQTFGCEGKRIEMEPGSFNYMPAKMIHEAWIPAGGIVFITTDGPWDINWVEGAPTAADVTK